MLEYSEQILNQNDSPFSFPIFADFPSPSPTKNRTIGSGSSLRACDDDSALEAVPVDVTCHDVCCFSSKFGV